MPNAGMRLAADGKVISYTGDTGSARTSSSWLAKPTSSWPLVLTHLWPGTEAADAQRSARAAFTGEIEVAVPGLERGLA
ncbi:hypothetical protein [Saccharopolyspora hattusasensis]|uniref:hypothetical protein n=1 Tax=Saccharopolyspora hattusasensis TaxID=1128679 RepID=UPI003D9846D0